LSAKIRLFPKGRPDGFGDLTNSKHANLWDVIAIERCRNQNQELIPPAAGQ
jgi:hypothetical protein